MLALYVPTCSSVKCRTQEPGPRSLLIRGRFARAAEFAAQFGQEDPGRVLFLADPCKEAGRSEEAEMNE